jgi:hypothetical protein
MHLTDSLAGFPNLGKKLLPMLRRPWPGQAAYWKQRYKGACQSLFFITKPTWALKFVSKIEEIAARHAYPIGDIGGYLQPIEHNRACHLEFGFFYDPLSHGEVERVRNLHAEAAKALLSEGNCPGWYTREQPTTPWR